MKETGELNTISEHNLNSLSKNGRLAQNFKWTRNIHHSDPYPGTYTTLNSFTKREILLNMVCNFNEVKTIFNKIITVRKSLIKWKLNSAFRITKIITVLYEIVYKKK